MINLAELKFVLTKPFRSIEISENLSFSNETNEFFKNEICKHKSYLEYGSGSSTIFLSKQKNLKLVSVESDYYFANHLKKIIKNLTILNPNIGLTGFWGYPLFFKNSYKKGFKYVNSPWEALELNYMPNVVLIDGRYRVACALNILLKASNKCEILILIDDYKGREEYKIVEKHLKLKTIAGRMGVFQYNLTFLDNSQINEIKKDLNYYLTKPE